MNTESHVRLTYTNQPRIPAPQYAETTFDLISDAIDAEAAGFCDPARFRAAVYRVLQAAEEFDLEQLAERQAWVRLTPILDSISRSETPKTTVDALRVLAGTAPLAAQAMAKKNGISKQAMSERVDRLGKFLGVMPRRRPPCKKRKVNV